MTHWIIVSTEGYWSNDLGWVYDEASATQFTTRELVSLPMQGRWLKVVTP